MIALLIEHFSVYSNLCDNFTNKDNSRKLIGSPSVEAIFFKTRLPVENRVFSMEILNIVNIPESNSKHQKFI